ncbi:DUF1934 domain-containing protein [Lacticaseibacillus songhuajiangensis]|jgi:uncharacterized beta-barrel protein YwiB (DUF1934 family)|uniref:DUF1934 domain-containing protein n=1 Tax=Lacticaseibacillus songhuajiangensis TaxID=1296539 RepID=UPI000F781ACA|nr:DUF1934 domain-containing protein [Lacticaseibacillus songhuajiangensis]
MDMSRGVPVRVQMETWVEQDGQQEHHQYDEPGQMVQLGNTIYIRYVEPDQDHLPVTVKIKGDNNVELTRGSNQGDTRLHLQFIAEKQVHAQYRTPYGVIPVDTITPRIDVAYTLEPVNGQVYVEYRLIANNEHLGDYRMRLIFSA